ncbi:MAG: serine/threonine protein phosphatase [Clostridia bacterium]|nr:serine/threonine protein phosphatase [Clostridia bacterium]
MTYFVSDLHGEYHLFCRLLEKIGFSQEDTMYICGDVLDKGDMPLALAKLIISHPNMHCILGNHELYFIKYYNRTVPKFVRDRELIISSIKRYFEEEETELDWEIVEWIMSLPFYIEERDFICVHAGIPTDGEERILSPYLYGEELVNDRRFKESTKGKNSEKCVFFGHTPTDNGEIIAYKRQGKAGRDISELYKVHLDTGTWQNGVLGCFCLENCKAIYVKKVC